MTKEKNYIPYVLSWIFKELNIEGCQQTGWKFRIAGTESR